MEARVAKQFVIGIDWYGPYSRETARQAAPDFGGGLYFAIGKPNGKGNYQRRPQYLGISRGNVVARCTSPQHNIMSQLDYDGGLWLGEISTAEPSGKKLYVTPNTLRYAEWLHVFFMKLPQNDRLNRPPPKPATLLNRWWRTDYVTPRYKRPHPTWPDLIDYAGREFRARTVWFGGRHVAHHPSEWNKSESE
jgi:hypothetical protein